MELLRGLALLLACQAAGEVVARAAALPVPGPVLGMLMLWPLLHLPLLRGPAATASNALLAHLPLLFVPVGVGAVAHLPALHQHGPALAAVLVLATLAGLAVTALAWRLLYRLAPGDAGA